MQHVSIDELFVFLEFPLVLIEFYAMQKFTMNYRKVCINLLLLKSAIAQQLQKHRFKEVKKETREKIKQNEMIPVKRMLQFSSNVLCKA